jgi:class 3 adenylate cyclase
MHRELRGRLSEAAGSSRWIFVAVVDIRDFSKFAEERESVETAYYLRQTYTKLLDDYFPEASFFKLTGDGVMVIFEHQPHEFEETARSVVSAALRLVDEFPGLNAQDPMLRFRTPTRVGIGIARGAASRLESGEYTLDYAGRVLNLAARLMDLARPGGLVVAGVPHDILPGEIATRLTDDRIFVRSVAERDSVDVLLTRDLTAIPLRNHFPLGDIEWKRQSTTMSRTDWERSAGRHLADLGADPTSVEEIKVVGSFHTGRGQSRRRLAFDIHGFDLELHAGKPRLKMPRSAITDHFGPTIRPNTKVTVEVVYPTLRQVPTPQEATSTGSADTADGT